MAHQGTLGFERAMKAGLEDYLGLKRYVAIMRCNSKDVSTDPDFQKLFNGYYNVRLSTAQLEGFYKVFQTARTAPASASFETILRGLADVTGRVEASYASKILATIDSSKPIWDSRVRNALERRSLISKMSELPDLELRLQAVVNAYRDLEEAFAQLLAADSGKACIAAFDEMFPAYAWISDVKKLDFILWCEGA